MDNQLTYEEIYKRATRIVDNEVKTSIPMSWLEILVENGEVSEEVFYPCCGEEEYPQEVLEIWIVSDWLADRLREKGECVTSADDWIQIWGRSTSGQSIALDSVIHSIVKDLYQVCL